MLEKNFAVLIVLIFINAVNCQTTKKACEAQDIKMECTGNDYLLIEDMLFGRMENLTCLTGNIQTTNCPSLPWALPKLQKYCNGRKTCHMKVRTELWGDPCPGTAKQGSVTYKCIACTNQETDSKCKQWASEGKCAQHMSSCYKTCSLCGQKDCGNIYTDVDCDNWAMTGECRANPSWMSTNCKESCLHCVPEHTVPHPFCEGDRNFLSCPPDYFLNILDIFWGRNAKSTCPNTGTQTTNCPTPSGMLSVAQDRYNGRPSAWLNAFNDNWKDPCPGTFKEGNIKYECTKCADKYSEFSCHQMKQQGRCTADYEYMMDKCYKTCSGCAYKHCGNAYYSPNNCTSKANNGYCKNTWTSNNCKEACSKCPVSQPGCGNNYIIYSECDYWAGKGDCSKYKSYHETNCKESCHFCGSAPPAPSPPATVSKDFCENDRKELLCPAGHFLNIEDIFWGRNDNTTCPHPHIFTTNCSTPAGALEKARKLYNGRNKAWIVAVKENWGDPCPNTYRAGNVKYGCVECVDIDGPTACDLLKQQGKCQSDYDNMMKNCFKSCSDCDKRQCGNSFNSSDDCKHKAKDGFCTNSTWTRENCREACGNCSVNQPACGNNYSPLSECDYWAAKGDCSPSTYLFNSCKESCHYCNYNSTAQTALDLTKPSNDHKVIVNGCEGSDLLLQCKNNNEYLLINDMLYGRLDNVSCNHSEIHRTDCPTLPGALMKLQTFSNGRKQVHFTAWNELWGDSCSGTAKVASVTYTCTACNNTKPDSECEQSAAQGKCTSEYDDMMKQCFKTCSKCGQKDCGNAYANTPKSNCDFWAMKGECPKSPTYTYDNCKESCLWCTDLPPVRQDFCEGKNFQIQCPAGHFISVDQMDWGRSDNLTCPHDSIHTVNCPTPPGTLEKARMMYNGRQKAWVVAVTSNWGDPCHGTHKAGRILYHCEACKDYGNSCAEFKAAGKCTSDYNTAVKDCFKTCFECDRKSCGNSVSTPDDCSAMKAQGLCTRLNVQRLCAQTCGVCPKENPECGDNYHPEAECDFWAGQTDCQRQPFIDYHYINCKESCNFCSKPRTDLVKPIFSDSVSASTTPTTYTTCEDSQIKLTCPAGKYILIEDMFYGRKDKYTCPYKKNILNTNCHSNSTNIKKLQTFANGRSWYWFPASSAAWGDPCPGTYKVAQVSYSCVECVNKEKDSVCTKAANEGRCSEVMEKCLKTCTQCGQKDCGNTYSPTTNCKTWTAGGKCLSNPIWMSQHCAKSCGSCGSNQNCEDKEVSTALCDTYALSGRCSGKDAVFMNTKCKQSCHRCTQPQPKLESMCEGAMKKLMCPGGHHILIEDVFFGRDDKAMCLSNIDVTNCTTAPGVFLKAAKQYNGRTSAYFVANIANWGDPCPGATKEARVKYSCRACSNELPEAECAALKANGTCSSKYDFMGTNCYKSCSGCDTRNCGNTYTSSSNCWTWAARGECQKSSVWMKINCREACRACDTYCGNNYSPDMTCDYHALQGQCTTQPANMISCKESCDQCTTSQGGAVQVTP